MLKIPSANLQKQMFIAVRDGVLINVAHVVWAEGDNNKQTLTLYLSAPGPDGKNLVKITDPKYFQSVGSGLDILK
jgi:hypothetical protein